VPKIFINNKQSINYSFWRPQYIRAPIAGMLKSWRTVWVQRAVIALKLPGMANFATLTGMTNP